MDEPDFQTAKYSQEQNGRKLKYLTSQSKPKFLGLLKLYGILWGSTIALWIFMWLVSLELPDSGAAKLYNGGFFESVMGVLILAACYSLHEWLWEIFTCKRYNRKMHRMIKKSTTYADFRTKYFNKYGV